MLSGYLVGTLIAATAQNLQKGAWFFLVLRTTRALSVSSVASAGAIP